MPETRYGRHHLIGEIRDHWLKNRGQDGSDWEEALGAVYDLALTSEREAVVRYLRAAANSGFADQGGRDLLIAAEGIEAGDHRHDTPQEREKG